MTHPSLATVVPELLTPAEVAAMFCVTVRTVAKYAREGRLPAIKTAGGRWRFYAGLCRRIKTFMIAKCGSLTVEARVRWLQEEGLL